MHAIYKVSGLGHVTQSRDKYSLYFNSMLFASRQQHQKKVLKFYIIIAL